MKSATGPSKLNIDKTDDENVQIVADIIVSIEKSSKILDDLRKDIEEKAFQISSEE